MCNNQRDGKRYTNIIQPQSSPKNPTCVWLVSYPSPSPNVLERYFLRSLLRPNRLRLEKVDSQEPFLEVPIEQVNYLAGHKSMAITKPYDHANEERYSAAIEALDAAGKTSSVEALAAAR